MTTRKLTKRDHEQFKAKMFPVKEKQCAECSRRLTDRNRKRMVIFHDPAPGMRAVTGYQLCRQCAGFLQMKEMHRLPNIIREIAEADFLTVGQTVGGVQ